MAHRRHALILACALLGAGCTGAPPDRPAGADQRALLPGQPQPAPDPAEAPLPYQRVTLAGGDVVVAGPDGYCIDPATVDRSALRAFAVIASCRILSAGRVGIPVEPLLVTVTVGPTGAAEDLPGTAALAAIAGAPLLGGASAPGFTTAHLKRGGAEVLEGGDDRYWRATFLQGGRLVGLALYAPAGSAMAGPLGQSMLEAVRDRIAQFSDPATPGSTAAAPAPRPQATGLLGRLFDRQDLP